MTPLVGGPIYAKVYFPILLTLGELFDIELVNLEVESDHALQNLNLFHKHSQLPIDIHLAVQATARGSNRLCEHAVDRAHKLCVVRHNWRNATRLCLEPGASGELIQFKPNPLGRLKRIVGSEALHKRRSICERGCFSETNRVPSVLIDAIIPNHTVKTGLRQFLDRYVYLDFSHEIHLILALECLSYSHIDFIPDGLIIDSRSLLLFRVRPAHFPIPTRLFFCATVTCTVRAQMHAQV